MENRKKWYNEILAFAEGKQIQSKRPNVLDKWEDDDYPLWNDSDFQFRIKEDPKYIQFTFEDREELRGRWFKRKSTGNEFAVHTISLGGVNGYTWREALEVLEFIDGTPFGKLVEEGGLE